jgi:hypothetical protein
MFVRKLPQSVSLFNPSCPTAHSTSTRLSRSEYRPPDSYELRLNRQGLPYKWIMVRESRCRQKMPSELGGSLPKNLIICLSINRRFHSPKDFGSCLPTIISF